MEKQQEQLTEEYSRMVNGNTILLHLEGWIKYVEGFIKGLQTTEKVSAAAVMDCVGEILEFMTTFKTQTIRLFEYCENILQENEQLKKQLNQLQTPQLTDNLTEEQDGE